MSDRSLETFGGTAKSLARNPLGVIALFLVLVYGLAALVITFGNSQKTPLVYFLIFFPVLVLIAFVWLVSRHSGKLFAPSDFRDEQNYVRMQLSAVASLAVASTKDPSTQLNPNIAKLVQSVQSAGSAGERITGARNQVLWVDDRPENNTYERKAFEAVGVEFTLALTTNDALRQLETTEFAAIISDMGRREGPREGYVLLDSLRHDGVRVPFFFSAASSAPEHRRETASHGGQGCTNSASELFEIVTRALLTRASG